MDMLYSYDGEFFHLIAAHGEPRYLDWIKQTGSCAFRKIPVRLNAS